jgi:acyl carrier protein
MTYSSSSPVPSFADFAALMARVFNFDPSVFVVTRDMTAVSVPGWDSVLHVVLMLEIETEFGVTISPEEAAELPTIGALYDFMIQRSASPI